MTGILLPGIAMLFSTWFPFESSSRSSLRSKESVEAPDIKLGAMSYSLTVTSDIGSGFRGARSDVRGMDSGEGIEGKLELMRPGQS